MLWQLILWNQSCRVFGKQLLFCIAAECSVRFDVNNRHLWEINHWLWNAVITDNVRVWYTIMAQWEILSYTYILFTDFSFTNYVWLQLQFFTSLGFHFGGRNQFHYENIGFVIFRRKLQAAIIQITYMWHICIWYSRPKTK